MGNEDTEQFYPEHSISLFSVSFWKDKGGKSPSNLADNELHFKSAPDTTLNQDELKIHRSSLTMKKILKDMNFRGA